MDDTRKRCFAACLLRGFDVQSKQSARVAELVDALVSGTSELTLVEVQVLFRAPELILFSRLQ